MGSTYIYSLPPATTASLEKLIDSGLLDYTNIKSDPNRPITAEIQRFIREHLDHKKSN
jgi:hypothetical protein